MDNEFNPPHPAVEELDLSKLYDALSDPTRRRMLLMLDEQGELTCTSMLVLGSKTAMSYHLARLRQSGLTRTRVEGTRRYMTLRHADLDERFPGLLDAVLTAIRLEERQATRPAKKAAAKRVVLRKRSAKTGR